MFFRLGSNNLVLQRRQDLLAVRQRHPDRCRRALGCVAAAGADFMRVYSAVAPDQLHHDTPLHPIPPTGHCGPAYTTPQV